MKIFVSKINESWIVDRVRNEWLENNKEISTNSIRNADIIWIVAPWLWKKIPLRHLKNKIVVCSMYHLDGSNAEIEDFLQRDQYVDYYHVISKNTERQIRPLTEKTIKSIPFWVDDKVFFEIKNKQELKKSLGLDQNKYYIGSFQRDTEGSDLKSPKLIKGPDRLIEIIASKFTNNKKIEVILTGKRRQYVISELEKIGVPYTYFEMADLKLLNELYNVLDLYIVSSRIEGGPQAIIECGLSKTPIISTDVGVAKEILAPKSIFEMSNFENAETDEKIAYENSVKFNLINGQQKFIDMFLEVEKTFF